MNRHSVTGGDAKRPRILEAAIRVFADKGFYNAKVSEIAREAGVADGTIYLYFKSKDDLLISLFEDRMEEVNETVRAALASAADPVEKLRRVVHLHLSMVEKNRHVAEVLIVELRQSAKFIKEYGAPKFGEFLHLIAGAIEEGQAAGVIRADLDPPMIARALFGALDELALEWLLRQRQPAGARPPMDLARGAEQLANLFIDGLRAPAVAPQRQVSQSASPARSSTPGERKRTS